MIDHACPKRETPPGSNIIPAPHCFCMSAGIQHAMMNHKDVQCCWCGKSECRSLREKPVPGHGPYRQDRVLE